MGMIRRLKPGDFESLWELGKPYIEPRLTPDVLRARDSYCTLLSQSGSFAEGEFEDEKLVGAVMASVHFNVYARKGHAGMDLWIGRLALLDRAIEWWEGRPFLRVLHLQFPNNVRPSMYRALRMRGFERSGDLNLLWR